MAEMKEPTISGDRKTRGGVTCVIKFADAKADMPDSVGKTVRERNMRKKASSKRVEGGGAPVSEEERAVLAWVESLGFHPKTLPETFGDGYMVMRVLHRALKTLEPPEGEALVRCIRKRFGPKLYVLPSSGAVAVQPGEPFASRNWPVVQRYLQANAAFSLPSSIKGIWRRDAAAVGAVVGALKAIRTKAEEKEANKRKQLTSAGIVAPAAPQYILKIGDLLTLKEDPFEVLGAPEEADVPAAVLAKPVSWGLPCVGKRQLKDGTHKCASLFLLQVKAAAPFGVLSVEWSRDSPKEPYGGIASFKPARSLAAAVADFGTALLANANPSELRESELMGLLSRLEYLDELGVHVRQQEESAKFMAGVKKAVEEEKE